MTKKEEDVAHPGKVDDDQGGGDDDDGEGEEEAEGEEEDVVADVLRTPPVWCTAGRGILKEEQGYFLFRHHDWNGLDMSRGGDDDDDDDDSYLWNVTSSR